jgi:protein involved in sex pheromone biosynthesis
MAENDPIRIIKHEIIPDTGSIEVRFADGRNSVYYYRDDNAGRRSITKKMTQEEAKAAARELARTERAKLDG